MLPMRLFCPAILMAFVLASGSSVVGQQADSSAGDQLTDSTWGGFRAIEPGRIIDHIFVSEAIDVKSLETLDPKTAAGRFASDHLPVRVRVAVSNTTSDAAP